MEGTSGRKKNQRKIKVEVGRDSEVESGEIDKTCDKNASLNSPLLL